MHKLCKNKHEICRVYVIKFYVLRLCLDNGCSCPADLLTNQTVKDRSPQPHLEGAAGRNRTHDSTHHWLLLYQLEHWSHSYLVHNLTDCAFADTMGKPRKVGCQALHTSNAHWGSTFSQLRTFVKTRPHVPRALHKAKLSRGMYQGWVTCESGRS